MISTKNNRETHTQSRRRSRFTAVPRAQQSLGQTVLSLIIVMVMTLSSLTSSVAYAQSAVPDIEPPIIELEEIPEGIVGQEQVFTALVTDDGTIKDVKLYYRLTGGQSYQSMPMEALASTNYYTASVATTAADDRGIEYYIQARDEGGNRVVKGFAFDPLVRALVEARAAPVAPQPQVVAPEPSGGIKVWHVVLGVLAVGALAGLAASGGGDDPSPAQTVPLTLTISTP